MVGGTKEVVEGGRLVGGERGKLDFKEGWTEEGCSVGLREGLG